jgi:LDH2 family malate/lactate/ureidoglycolate dehydrogenase
MITTPYPEILATLTALLERWGFTAPEAGQVATIILDADLAGINSHGIQRLGFYRRIIREGWVVPGARCEVLHNTAVSALVDARQAMGHLAADNAMRLAIDKAQSGGIGVVTVRNSNHFGTAGYFASLASAVGLLGICATNSYPIMPPTFGRVPLIGSNPLAFAFPCQPHDFLYDASSTVVSLGRVELYERLGEELPAPWGINDKGQPTRDPAAILGMSPEVGRGIYPLGGAGEQNGGHKGYGQGLMIEMLTAILSGGWTAADIADNGGVGACHFFLALDPALFGDVIQMQEELGRYFKRLRAAAEPSPGASEGDQAQQRVYIHGEKEALARTRQLHEGLSFGAEIWRGFGGLLSDAGLPTPLLKETRR